MAALERSRNFGIFAAIVSSGHEFVVARHKNVSHHVVHGELMKRDALLTSEAKLQGNFERLNAPMEYAFAASFRQDPDGGVLVTFPDVPEAITHGDDYADARRNAAEALGLALRGYLALRLALPRPKAKNSDLVSIPVEAGDALKIAVIEAFTRAGISKAELARRIGKAVTEAQRILDPDHNTKLPSLEEALAALGKEVVVSVRDAA